ncbi:MAG: hypothetical protein ACE5GX_03205 [Thermoanaerobaculia bacterium]
MSFIYSLPKRLDQALRWADLRHSRIDNTPLHKKGFLEGYSPLAMWLPIPLLVSLAYGLSFLPAAVARLLSFVIPAFATPDPLWRGLPLLLVCAAIIVVHALACRRLKGRRLPRFQWILVALLVVAIWLLSFTGSNRAWSSDPYFHLFGPFAVFVLFLGMPACRWWAEFLITRGNQRAEFRKAFAPHLQDTQLYFKPADPEDRPLRIIRSIFLVLLKSPLSLILFPAFAMLVARPGALKVVFFSVLAATWALLTAVHYNDRLRTFQILLRQTFLYGWSGVVSFLVIVLAAARIAKVSYVTTVLDQASWTVILGLVLQLYLIFWLYDYWRQRALAEVLLGLLHKGEEHPHQVRYGKDDEEHNAGRLQIHGAGRFVAIRRPKKNNSKHKWEFESYQPLEVFQKLHRQLDRRERRAWAKKTQAEKDQAADGEAAVVAERLDALEEKVPIYTALPAVVLAAVVVVGFVTVFKLDQATGYPAPPETTESFLVELFRGAADPAESSAAELTESSFDLIGQLEGTPKGQPYYAVAGSGGGTRAALWTYEVLRELSRRGAAGRVALLSSVSGGSAGVAYFAGHHEKLVGGTDGDWEAFRAAMAERYIHQVLAGVGEWRLARGTRLGQLLTDGFERKFFPESTGPGSCKTLGCVEKLGVVFNTSVTGSFEPEDARSKECYGTLEKERECGTLRRAGTRLVLTNLASLTEESMRHSGGSKGWPLDFGYVVLKNDDVRLTTAAALSANFPPIFSNALVRKGSGEKASRYWVTDGGAVENRGLISLLLALRSEIEAKSSAMAAAAKNKSANQSEGEAGQVTEPGSYAGTKASTQPKSLELPQLAILVAEASGLSSPGYKEDRGLGALGPAKVNIASRLIAELAEEVDADYRKLSGGPGVEIVYLPMPTALRAAFGTHWQMPNKIALTDPGKWFGDDGETIPLDTEEILQVIDLLFEEPGDRKLELHDSLWRRLFSSPRDVKILVTWLGQDWDGPKGPLARFNEFVPRSKARPEG